MELIVAGVVAIAGVLIVWTIVRLVRLLPISSRAKAAAINESRLASNSLRTVGNTNEYYGDGVVLGEVREVEGEVRIADYIDPSHGRTFTDSPVDAVERPNTLEVDQPPVRLDSEPAGPELIAGEDSAGGAGCAQDSDIELSQGCISSDETSGEGSDRYEYDSSPGPETLEQDFEQHLEGRMSVEPISSSVEGLGREKAQVEEPAEESAPVAGLMAGSNDNSFVEPVIPEFFERELPFADDEPKIHAGMIEEVQSEPISEPSRPQLTNVLSEEDFEEQRKQFDRLRNSSDRIIDAIAWLPSNDRIISRMEVLTAYQNCDARPTKEHQILGVNCDSDYFTSVFTDDEFSKYTDLYITMQLVDESGPVMPKQCLRYQDLVLRMSSALSRNYQYAEAPDVMVKKAKKIKQLVDDYRNEAVLVLMFKVPTFTDIGYNYIVGEYGFERRDDGSYVRRSEANQPVPNFYLLDSKRGARFLSERLDQTTEHKALITFSNLPCVRNPVAAFDDMLDAAEDLADRLDATLVDRNFNVIDRDQIHLIREDIARYAKEMREMGITPGRDTAIRLFHRSTNDSPSSNLPLQFEAFDQAV